IGPEVASAGLSAHAVVVAGKLQRKRPRPRIVALGLKLVPRCSVNGVAASCLAGLAKILGGQREDAHERSNVGPCRGIGTGGNIRPDRAGVSLLGGRCGASVGCRLARLSICYGLLAGTPGKIPHVAFCATKSNGMVISAVLYAVRLP